MTSKGQPRIEHDKEARMSQAEYKYKNEQSVAWQYINMEL